MMRKGYWRTEIWVWTSWKLLELWRSLHLCLPRARHSHRTHARAGDWCLPLWRHYGINSVHFFVNSLRPNIVSVDGGRINQVMYGVAETISHICKDKHARTLPSCRGNIWMQWTLCHALYQFEKKNTTTYIIHTTTLDTSHQNNSIISTNMILDYHIILNLTQPMIRTPHF